MHFKKALLALLVCLPALIAGAQNSAPKEYLNIAGPLSLSKQAYHLVWTTHPSANYYKQEYLTKGDRLPAFRKMVLIEALTGTTPAKALAAAKVAELQQLKASNPMVNYQSFEKDGEILLDFLMSEMAPDGRTARIVERNVYRYAPLRDKNGQSGVLLFAVSERAYGNEITPFLTQLKSTRNQLLREVGAYALPQVTLAK